MREGRITSRAAGLVEIAFPPPHRHALVVGAAARVALEARGSIELPDRSAKVVERWDRGRERRYRFALAGRRSLGEPFRSGGRAASSGLCAVLRFGRLEVDADLLGEMDGGVVLRVAPSTEARLCSADAIEIVAREHGERRAEIRLAGWIERRILERAAVRYQFRVDERLSEDGAAQHARLRSRLCSATRAARLAKSSGAAAST